MTRERDRKDEYGLTWHTRRTLFHLAMDPVFGLRGTGSRGELLMKLGYAQKRRYGVAITDEGVLLAAVLMLKGGLSEPMPGPTFDERKAQFLADWALPPEQAAGYQEPFAPDARMGHGAGELLGFVPKPSPDVLDDEP